MIRFRIHISSSDSIRGDMVVVGKRVAMWMFTVTMTTIQKCYLCTSTSDGDNNNNNNDTVTTMVQ